MPVSQNQRWEKQIKVQKLFPLFSFARSERPVNHFQVKACAQFWNTHRCFAVRRKIEANGAAPNIPPKSNQAWKNCFSPVLYRDRNAIERMFGRLTRKDSPVIAAQRNATR